MQQDQDLNKLLKEIWRIHWKHKLHEKLTTEEIGFYNDRLPLITEYYKRNSAYWESQVPVS